MLRQHCCAAQTPCVVSPGHLVLTGGCACAAEQVMGEDTKLVVGQQRRLQQGADVWAHPVAYDKLGVRYRRWRNSVASGDSSARAAAEAELARTMTAGELFACDEEECLVEP